MRDALPLGKKVDGDVEALERFAVWFYRLKVRDESVRAIARAYYGEEGDARRKDVRQGAARAQDLLGLTPYSFADGAE